MSAAPPPLSPKDDGAIVAPALGMSRGKGRRAWPWRVLAVLIAITALGIGTVLWVLTTPQGARLVLGKVQGLLGEGARLEGVEGQIGGVLRVKAIEISRADLYVLVEDFEMDASPVEPLRGLLHIHRLAAKSVVVRTASSEAAARIPLTIQPPYALRIDDAKVAELRIGTLSAAAKAEKDVVKRRELMQSARDQDFILKDLFVRAEGGPREWKVAEARAETTHGKASVAGSLGTVSPFPLEAAIRASGSVGERPYQAEAKLKGTLKSFEAAVEGELAGQRATGHAVLEPFSTVPVRSLDVRAQGVDLSRYAASAPRTRLSLEARLAAQSKAYGGPIRIENAEPGTWDRQRLPFSSAQGRVVVTGERIDVADLEVALLGGGSAGGRATLQASGIQAQLSIAGVDLAALHRGLQKTRLAGRVAVTGNRGAQRFEVALKDPRFDVEGRGALAHERLEIETVRVRTGGGSVAARGALSLAGHREFRFEGDARHFDPAAFVKTTPGDLNFGFVASGTMADGLAGEARIDIAPSRYAGQPASGRIAVAGDRHRIASAEVQVALGDARIDARGSFGGAGDAMDVSLRAPNLAALAKPFGVQLAGRLEADARLTGTFQSPAGRVSLSGSNLALPSNLFVRELTLLADAGSEPDSPVEAALHAKGIALGKESPPTPFAETLDATLKGTRLAHRLDVDTQMTRESRMRFALQGGLDPRARDQSWSGRVESLALAGRGAFALAAPVPLAASTRRVELGDATLRGEWGEARLAVTRWTPRTLDLKGSSNGIQIQNLARSLRMGSVPRSTLVVAGDWDIHLAEAFEGSLNLRRVSGDLRVGEPPLPLGLKEMAVKVDVVRGRASAMASIVGDRIGRIQGEGTALIVRGEAGWEIARGSPVAARLVADVPDLAAIAPWLGPDAKAGGRLEADVAVSGTGAEPRISGTARLQDLMLREPQTGFEVEQGQLALRLTGKSVVIEQFTASAPWHPSEGARAKLSGMILPRAGSLKASGSIDLGANMGSIRIQASQVPVTQLASRFLALSGEARLEASTSGLLATGDFKADAGWIGALDSSPPSVSDDVVVVRASQPAPEEAKAKKDPIRVDLRLSLGDRVHFQGRGLDTRLSGDLRVSGDPSGGLRANGTIVTLGGIYKGYGQNLSIERGVLRFSGPLENPVLNVLAVRKGLPVEPGVEVLGTVQHPRVRLVSAPDVPEPEKLSWLVLGRGPSELGPGDASVLVAAAATMFGKGDAGDIGKKLGLDEVRIGRADTNSVLGVLPQSTVAGRTGSASAAEVVSVGKRLGKNVYLTYEQGLADAERAGFLPGLDAVYRWTFP